jgi:hypothetical protein
MSTTLFDVLRKSPGSTIHICPSGLYQIVDRLSPMTQRLLDVDIRSEAAKTQAEAATCASLRPFLRTKQPHTILVRITSSEDLEHSTLSQTAYCNAQALVPTTTQPWRLCLRGNPPSARARQTKWHHDPHHLSSRGRSTPKTRK